MRLSSYRKVRIPNLSVRILRDVLMGAGLDYLDAFAAAGLDPVSAERIGGFVSGEEEIAFQRKFVELTPDRTDLWIKVGKGYSLTALGYHGLAMATSPTIAAFTEVSQAGDLTYSLTDVAPIRNSNGKVAGIGMVHGPSLPELIPFSVHRDVTAMLRSLMMITMVNPLPLTEVQLPLLKISPEFARLISAPIRLRTNDVQIHWDEDFSQAQLPFGSEFQHKTYIRQAQDHVRRFRLEQEFTRTVINAIKDTSGAAITIGDVAVELNSSVRTLQRRLVSADSTFRELRDQARYEMASSMLIDTNDSIATIARRLGYGEPTSFTAAFKRWSGVSPSHYRATPRPREGSPG